MGEIVRRLLWFFVVSSAVAYCVFLFAGKTVYQSELSAARVVRVRDLLQPGVHHLTGMVMVHQTCDELKVTTEDISPATYKLDFSTWSEPSVDCVTDETPRIFHATVFGPAAGVTFVGSLDDEPLTIVTEQEPYQP